MGLRFLSGQCESSPCRPPNAMSTRFPSIDFHSILSHFFLLLSRVSLHLWLSIIWLICPGVFYLVYPTLYLLTYLFLDLKINVFHQIWVDLSHFSLNFYLSSPRILTAYIFYIDPQIFTTLFILLQSLFFGWTIFADLFSHSLISFFLHSQICESMQYISHVS